MTETAGWLHTVQQAVIGGNLLATWRVTTDRPDIAQDIARLLGGTPRLRQPPGTDRLEVLTSSAALSIIVGKTADGLPFRLAQQPDMGIFRVCFGSWTTTEVMGDAMCHRLATLTTSMSAQLSLENVDFTTLSGIHLRYLRPKLAVGKPWRQINESTHP